MSHARLAAAIAAVLLAALSISCIDYSEELELNADLSGRITATIGINELLATAAAEDGTGRSFSKEDVEREVTGIDGLTLESAEEFRSGGKRFLKYTLRFDSLDRLAEATVGGTGVTGASAGEEENLLEMLGGVRLEREGPNWVFERKVSLDASDISGEPVDAAANAFAEAMLSGLLTGNEFVYEVRFPSEVITANAPEIDDERRVVTWRYSLAQLVREPASMRAEIQPPSTRVGALLFVAVAALVLLPLVAIGIFRLRTR